MDPEQKASPPDQSSELTTVAPQPPSPPAWEDYWAHQVAEKAKNKVLAYFGVLGVLMSLLITLYGVNGIKTLLEDKFTKVVAEKEKVATSQIERQLKEFEEKKLKAFELKLNALEKEARYRKEEFVAKLVLPLDFQDTSPPAEIQLIDLSTDIGPIRDQGRDGTSVGFPVSYALHAAIKKKDGIAVELSARSIYVQAKKYDKWPGEDYEGSSLEGALIAVKTLGAYLETDWPYSSKISPNPHSKPAYKISDYTELIGIEQLRAALVDGKIIMVQVNTTNDFFSPDSTGRIVIKTPLQTAGGHAITIVGYNSETAEFKFANSWGTRWGKGGFGYIRDVDLQKILVIGYTLKL